jgi:DNA topoisomerase-1
MTTLVIVESPAKCKKIEEYLGPGYACIATFGHFRDLPDLKHVDVSNQYKPTFSLMKAKSSQVQKLKKAIASSKEILLATDDDREGEGIAWHVCAHFGLSVKHTKRIVFHEITKTAVMHAVSNPKRVDMNMVNAQQARQILDLVVGFKLSPVLWENISQRTKTGLSAGRCQTPALRLVFDNQKEIDGSPGERSYVTTGYFGNKNIPFILEHGHTSPESAEEFLCDSVSHSHTLSKSGLSPTTKAPPSPFTTSGAQQASNNEFRMSPKDTMRCLQTLYEGGHITYMRTDSAKYSKEFIAEATGFIRGRWGDDFVMEDVESVLSVGSTPKKKKTKDEPKAQEAHEAIRPTNVKVDKLDDADLSPKDKKVYQLVWRNTVESCMAPARYNLLKCSLSAPQDLHYKYTSDQLVFAGWKIVRGQEAGDPLFGYLMALAEGVVMAYCKITSKVTLKNLKQHYTEARLVQMLEKRGIGRPSTFSSLVDKIQSRGYVTKGNVEGKTLKCADFELVGNELEEIETERTFGAEKGKLVLQPLGALVLEFLLKHFGGLFEYDYTKHMEDRLDEVAKGAGVWHEICADCDKDIEAAKGRLEPTDKATIRVDDYHTYLIGKHGPVIKRTKGGKTDFIGVREDVDIDTLKAGGYTLEEIVAPERKTGQGICTYDGSTVVLKSGKFGPYLQWGTNTKSLSALGLSESGLTAESVLEALGGAGQGSGTIRQFSDNVSLRSGKYGNYIFYKTRDMKKPRFINLKGFKGDAATCPKSLMLGWLHDQHHIPSEKS